MKAPAGALWLLLGGVAGAASGDEAWHEVIALDVGPKVRPRSAAEAQNSIVAHLGTQERALRSFLASYAEDARAFEANLRLSRLLALRAEMQGDAKARAEAERLLDGLEKMATPEQRVEIGFARLSQAMRRMDGPARIDREALLGEVRKFQSAHPADRRLAEVLAEIAPLFDSQPKKELTLLLEAQALARDEQLKKRIADDLRRVELFGKALALAGPGVRGKTVDVADFRGRVVVVCFFAGWSEPSLLALEAVRKVVAGFPNDRVQTLGVSLDTQREALIGLLREKEIGWPVVSDNQGWESPLIRSLGINTLPTVWLVDREGTVRSLDALANPAGQIRQLLGER